MQDLIYTVTVPVLSALTDILVEAGYVRTSTASDHSCPA